MTAEQLKKVVKKYEHSSFIEPYCRPAIITTIEFVKELAQISGHTNIVDELDNIQIELMNLTVDDIVNSHIWS